MTEERQRRDKPALQVARSIDRSDALVALIRRLRERLPGDPAFGDPLSTAGRKHLAAAEQRLAELTTEEVSVLRELGLGGLQMWQAFLESRGRSEPDAALTIAFTDLVGFSQWALRAGDEEALALLRSVGSAWEPPVTRRGGTVVKRLGDGLMTVFTDAQAAYDAVAEARNRLSAVTAAGYRPRMRAGLHTGNPRRLGGDYLGVDVNIAARLVERASADEVLASHATVALLDPQRLRWRRKKSLALRPAKGVPDELGVYAVRSR